MKIISMQGYIYFTYLYDAGVPPFGTHHMHVLRKSRITDYEVVNGGIKILHYQQKRYLDGWTRNQTPEEMNQWRGDGYDFELTYKTITYGDNNTYLLSNDKFDEVKSNKKIKTFNLNNSENFSDTFFYKYGFGKNPFFTNKNTYKQLEEIIKFMGLVSKYNFSLKNTLFKFYNPDKKTEINKDSFIDSSKIYLKILGDNIHSREETQILNLEIPFFNINLGIKKTNKFIYSGVKDKITNNKNTYYWKFINGVWNLFTNQIVDLNLDKDNNISSFNNGTEHINVVSGQKYSLLKDKNKFEEKTKVCKWSRNILFKNNVSDQIHLKVNFEADYVLPTNQLSDSNGIFGSNAGFSVKPMNKDPNDITNAPKMAIDVNGDGNTQYDEVLPTNIVHNPYHIILNDPHADIKKIKTYKLKNNIWKQSNINFHDKESQGITDDLVMFTTKNEYGNNITQVVKYVNNNDTSNASQKTISRWDISNPSYTPLLQMSEEQNIKEDEFNKSTFHQVKNYFNKAKTYDSLYSLSKFAVNYDSLEAITNKYESNHVTFKDVKADIEKEIKNQVIKQVFDEKQLVITDKDIEVTFPKMKDTQTLITDNPINFSIKPNGGFKFRNSYNGSFKSKTFNYFNHYNPDTTKLSSIASNVEQGTKFSSIKYALENEIKNQLRKIKFYSKDLTFKWNYGNNEHINKNKKVSVQISSLSSVYKGNRTINFNIKPYYSLSKFKIDKEELLKISNKISGKKFKEAKVVLNRYILDRLSSEGYNTKYIRIVWNVGDEIIVPKGKEISYKISSTNKAFVRGEVENLFQFGILPLSQHTKKTVYVSVIASLLGVFLIFIIYTWSRRVKKSKTKKLLMKHNETALDLSVVDQLENKGGEE